MGDLLSTFSLGPKSLLLKFLTWLINKPAFKDKGCDFPFMAHSILCQFGTLRSAHEDRRYIGEMSIKDKGGGRRTSKSDA